MIGLAGVELFKIWGKKTFAVALSVLLCVNLFALWYTQQPDEDSFPVSAYRTLSSELHSLTPLEQTQHIAEQTERARAFELLEQLSLMQAAGTPNEGFIEAAKAEQPGLFEYYETQYRADPAPRYTASLRQDAAFLTELNEQAQRAANYPAFLQGIADKADSLSGISIFASAQTDTFSGRNIQKTARDYAGLENTPIIFDVSDGMETATGFVVTDIISILILFFIASSLLFVEKGKGLFSLIKGTPKGRGPTIAAKLIALAVSLGGITLLLFGSNLLFEACTIGLGDLLRSLQSVPSFLASALPIQVWQYLLLFLASKWASYLLVGLLILLISIFSKHPVVSYLVFAGVYGVSYVLYALIPATSGMNLFKYCNLVFFMQTNALFQRYLNFNLFGYPVHLLAVAGAAAVFVLAALTAAVVISFCRKRSMQAGSPPFQKFFSKISLFRCHCSASVLRHEAYKLLILNKALVFAAACLLFICAGYLNSSRYLSPQEAYYKTYMTTLQGGLTPEKANSIETEQQRMQAARTRLGEIDAQQAAGELTPTEATALRQPFERILNSEPVFRIIYERYRYIQQNPGTEFVYDTGYQKLFDGSSSEGQMSALQMIILCTLCFSAVFAMEYQNGAAQLLGTTPRGRRHTVGCKTGLCLGMMVPLFLTAYLPMLLSIGRDFGFPGLSSPISSLPQYAHLPGCISVLGFLGLLYAIRLVACACLVLILLTLSLKLKNTLATMGTASLVLAAPVLLTMMGLDFFRYFSFLPLLEWGGAAVNGTGLWIGLFYLLLIATTGACCLRLLLRNYCRAKK